MPETLDEIGQSRRPRKDLPELIGEAAEPMPEIYDPLFGRLFDRFIDGARVVLLGEATHGTAEFYQARDSLTRWMIEEHGFRIVALEADWPDARVLDAYARFRHKPPHAADAFSRFPTWMWRNREFDTFLQWLRDHNRFHTGGHRAGVYGLDLYNLSASMRTVIDFLDREDPEAGRIARERYGCLEPWAHKPAAYGRQALSAGYTRCEGAVTAMLRDMLARQVEAGAKDAEGLLDAAQSARLVRDAEAYYRAMYYGGSESWNLRDRHMFETLESLLDAHGPDARAVVWAHNSHIGDARATEAGVVRDELNIGQLCRERWGDAARLIGFGTHMGEVACADDWDESMRVRAVQPSLPGSCERAAHDCGRDRFLLDLREGENEAVRHAMWEPRLQRFIGVVYRPDTERASHYLDCRLPEQFDAYVWFDETTAVTPLPTRKTLAGLGEEETWPSGL